MTLDSEKTTVSTLFLRKKGSKSPLRLAVLRSETLTEGVFVIVKT